MKNSIIIIDLIKEHMRLTQYLAALRKLGIEAYDFDLDLMSIVAKLMDVKEITDSWMELYVTELSKCENIPIEPLGKNLYMLAEECYKALIDFGETSG
jgi:hypothetical protein